MKQTTQGHSKEERAEMHNDRQRMKFFLRRIVKRLILQNPLYRAQDLDREQGQAAVEFALTLLITLTLIFGMIEFSRAVYASSVVKAAAQEGARAGIIDATDTAAITAAIEEKLIGLDLEKVIEINIEEPDARTVQVEVVYQFEFVVPLIETITGSDIELRGSASMVSQ
jgi:hypothetical protein